MADTENRPTNFIRNIIDGDLASGKHASTHTRFPPEPNGFLHIGHAKSICLNFGIAQDYKGLCNLRFDDTNPEKEDIDYVNSIQEDVKWLGFDWDGEICYSSNYFDKLYGYAVELIEKGLAYVCFLSPEQAREYRGTLTEPGKNSPHRDTSPEENLALFEKMKNGEFKEGECVLRAKIDMASSFMVLRDPIIYRIRFVHHHQTGDKWCIYPMYDFTHCISDALEGITHSLCTLEFQDNRRLYDWVLENISIECQPQQIEFSRLNLEYTVMSKRKLNDLVVNGQVEGWDDPRMPTIAGLRRRGYTPASIREFCKRIGITKQDNMVEMGMLEACIRDDLNENAPRAMAVLDPVKIVIENYDADKVEMLSAPNHPTLEMGERELPFTREIFIEREDFRVEANKKFKRLVLGKEVRLRNAYVIKAERIEEDSAGNITTIYCTYDADTLGKNPADGRKVKGVIHWVSASHCIEAEVRQYDRLFNVPNPAAAEDFATTLNPESLVVIANAKLEPSLANANAEQGFQFERLGYYSRDNKSEALTFNQTVGLRDSWAKIEKA
ncbi:glutamine--tRNA ligase [Pseudoalteromonas luteoviolacea]|uniref:Glutamine--tRNA ligase n=1 Tax=Pseudoalteromonas luteoviolacea S4054 TaxID=1129367 RepID=A0A0F6ADP1_9GAMM|nr:glutamine--tRNA ligase [Pseudoalteromonas luteoviolacea]AOT08494.1 glutamine--tRNA ligase [Pseudoalteromonas luteoviolacea]AOT13410.1 glutamine--tRNA ligase [Pseudoalteromonas luteoviolacea]AOT18323.1 glutamine--tRNA ligase [Pseudoalteromonas luteoviolacea]KKE83509.1 glutaminyl-tRNA synthetase [Pseudoalteromonas luteoviolacea S4054]KZN75946.1 glutaminyl-tRNA synthetase [Pseudoalteromonas luteoviolacea S4047-1]